MGSDVIFSLVDGYVWACWPGTSGSVRLGIDKEVIEGMEGFLAQCALGERLNRPADPSAKVALDRHR
jgi:hypothetical protein